MLYIWEVLQLHIQIHYAELQVYVSLKKKNVDSFLLKKNILESCSPYICWDISGSFTPPRR